MAMRPTLEQDELHCKFLWGFDGEVAWCDDLSTKPFDVDFKADRMPPLPPKVRLYIYNATHPPGGRTDGEHKIQLIVPGQGRGERASFAHAEGCVTLLIGYEPELEVFILWDAGMYPDFSYSRNVQVRAETVYTAFAGDIGLQRRHIRGQGVETVVTARAPRLREALIMREALTIERLLGG
jgi:hypothetical protein